MAALSALVWIVAATIWLVAIVAAAADNGLLDWLYDSAYMDWFERRLWMPLKRMLGLEAVDRWLSQRRD